MRTSATTLVGLTVVGMVLAMIILVVISPVFVVLGFVVPLIPRAVVRYKLILLTAALSRS